MAPEYPFFLAGRWRRSDRPLEVTSPFNDQVAGTTFHASASDLEEATVAAQEAFPVLRGLPAYERAGILSRIAQGLNDRKSELARIIALEAGKPIRDSTFEVERAVFTFEVGAEEARRLGGEVLPLDLMPQARGKLGIVRRFPIGPIAAITPFNFPLNLAAHKVAPAIACGNPVVLKPPSKTPLTMLTACRIIAESGLPRGALSVLPMSREVDRRMVSDPRFKLLTFTGSGEVGWGLRERAGHKKVLLELGGNAGVIVDREAGLEHAAQRISAGSFSYAGQSCISVQRVYVHEEIFESFTNLLLKRVSAIKMGDPLDPATDLGPMIDPGAVARTQAWTEEAVAQGARILAGGKARGRFFEPTVLTDVDPSSKVCSLEVFAPLVSLFRVHDFEEAVAQVNSSAYGLQAGVFTESLAHAFYAYQEIEAGGVIINDTPSFRKDHMPYGGVKESGMGREGIRYAIEEMTEPRIMVLSGV
ncbi:MAG: aldehyde dehydrogenase family protein [Dehalococcoidia bacterium]|nr:aldehyde dehydrogenase family protein [Dehalococcoidia bacterium]